MKKLFFSILLFATINVFFCDGGILENSNDNEFKYFLIEQIAQNFGLKESGREQTIKHMYCLLIKRERKIKQGVQKLFSGVWFDLGPIIIPTFSSRWVANSRSCFNLEQLRAVKEKSQTPDDDKNIMEDVD